MLSVVTAKRRRRPAQAATIACAALFFLTHFAQAGDRGRIVGFREDAPPFSSRAGNAAEPAVVGAGFEGFSVDLCREILGAQPAQGRVEAFPMTAESRTALLAETAPRFDLLCDPTSVTLKRLAHCAFTFPYFATGISFTEATGDATLEDLADARIGLVGGTTAEAKLRSVWSARFSHAPNVVPFANYEEGIAATARGEVAALFGDQILLQGAVERSKTDLKMSDDIFSIELYGFCVNPDQPQLLASANRTLAEIYRSGRIFQIVGRHFGGRGTSPILTTLYTVYAVPDD